MIVAFAAKIVSVEEKFERQYVSGFGPESVFRQVSRGWFVLLEGSNEAIFISKNRPDYARVGDTVTVKLIFPEQSSNANP